MGVVIMDNCTIDVITVRRAKTVKCAGQITEIRLQDNLKFGKNKVVLHTQNTVALRHQLGIAG